VEKREDHKTRSQINSTGKLETNPHVSVTFDSRSSRLIDIYGNGLLPESGAHVGRFTSHNIELHFEVATAH